MGVVIEVETGKGTRSDNELKFRKLRDIIVKYS